MTAEQIAKVNELEYRAMVKRCGLLPLSLSARGESRRPGIDRGTSWTRRSSLPERP